MNNTVFSRTNSSRTNSSGTRAPAEAATPTPRKARLVRSFSSDHVCPSGLKARALLKRHGYIVEDEVLDSRAAVDAFKAEAQVTTTPQIYIDGTRIGGLEALARHLDYPAPATDQTTYQPVLAVFAMTALMALAASQAVVGSPLSGFALRWFVALSMCVLAILKLRDLQAFSNQFLGYDLLAQRWIPYAYLYPFLEGGIGVLMLADQWLWLAAPVALAIGSIGAVSVIYAVYVQQRTLRCACVGGSSNVPLGFTSLTENLIMVAMAISIFVGR